MNKPKLVIDYKNNKRYYVDHSLHREDGPAVEYKNGNKYWYINGVFYREDGPALEYIDGDNF